MDDFPEMMDDNSSLSNDQAFNELLDETYDAIQDATDFSLPNDMVISAVNSASDFFGLPYPEITYSESTCEMPNDISSYNDDVIGIARSQMIEIGIYGEDALCLVMTHECCHRALQSYDNMDSWEQELACDYFAGVRAVMQNMETSHFEDVLINLQGSETHPIGNLRVDFVEYGMQVAHKLIDDGIQPTFKNCLEHFNQHLIEEKESIAEQKDDVLFENSREQERHSDTLSFTGKYSESEINNLKNDVRNLESELSYKDSEVEHHRRCVSLADTIKGHENGNYDYEVDKLNKAISIRNDTASELNNARSKLRNAL